MLSKFLYNYFSFNIIFIPFHKVINTLANIYFYIYQQIYNFFVDAAVFNHRPVVVSHIFFLLFFQMIFRFRYNFLVFQVLNLPDYTLRKVFSFFG